MATGANCGFEFVIISRSYFPGLKPLVLGRFFRWTEVQLPPAKAGGSHRKPNPNIGDQLNLTPETTDPSTGNQSESEGTITQNEFTASDDDW